MMFRLLLALAALKFRVGIETSSPSLKKDAACSLCGACLSLGVLAGVAATAIDARLWWLDGMIPFVAQTPDEQRCG